MVISLKSSELLPAIIALEEITKKDFSTEKLMVAGLVFSGQISVQKVESAPNVSFTIELEFTQ